MLNVEQFLTNFEQLLSIFKLKMLLFKTKACKTHKTKKNYIKPNVTQDKNSLTKW
jgi:hypothetical protein